MKFKDFQKKITQKTLFWWEVAPALIAIVIPNILEPEWVWRTVSMLVVAIVMIIIALHALLAPNMIMEEKRRAMSKWHMFVFGTLCVTAVLLIPLMLFDWIVPIGKDISSAMKGERPIIEVVSVQKNQTGGVGVWFIGQSLDTSAGKFSLWFNAEPIHIAEYEITYFHGSKFIYDIEPKQ